VKSGGGAKHEPNFAAHSLFLCSFAADGSRFASPVKSSEFSAIFSSFPVHQKTAKLD
jgi:dihydroxyacetone kinase